MLFVSKTVSLEKVAFINSSYCVICELNWIIFMATVKHFRVKMRVASFCCVNLIKYTMPHEFVCGPGGRFSKVPVTYRAR